MKHFIIFLLYSLSGSLANLSLKERNIFEFIVAAGIYFVGNFLFDKWFEEKKK